MDGFYISVNKKDFGRSFCKTVLLKISVVDMAPKIPIQYDPRRNKKF